jgi:hypothetical protein
MSLFVFEQPRHCQRVRIPDLDPIRRATRPVRPISPLSDDSFQAELARMLKYDRSIRAVDMLGQPDALMEFRVISSIAQKTCECIAASLPWLPAQVLSIELEQIERI